MNDPGDGGARVSFFTLPMLFSKHSLSIKKKKVTELSPGKVKSETVMLLDLMKFIISKREEIKGYAHFCSKAECGQPTSEA